MPSTAVANPTTARATTASALILGDSMIKYLQENITSKLFDVQVVERRGATISRLRKYLLQHDDIHVTAAPDIVLIHVGTNDLEWIFSAQ